LLELLTNAHDKWIRESAELVGDDGPLIVFRSVLACDPDAIDVLTGRMNAANATYARLGTS
jgi:hypothetical protein